MNIEIKHGALILLSIAILIMVGVLVKEFRKKSKPAYQEKLNNQSDLHLMYTLQATIENMRDRLNDLQELFIPDQYKNTLIQPLIDHIAFLKSLKENIEKNHSGDKPLSNKQWQAYLEEAEYESMDPSISLIPNYLHSLRAISHEALKDILGTNKPEPPVHTGNPVIDRQQITDSLKNKVNNKIIQTQDYKGLDV